MAGLCKAKKKRDSANPSTVLIIFTIFFALLSIGVGGWSYSVFSQQADLEKKLIEARKGLDPSKEQKEYYEFLAIELLYPYGHDVDGEKAAFGGTSVEFHKLSSDEFFPKDPNAANRFSKEKSYAVFKKFIDAHKTKLAELRAQGYTAESYMKLIPEFSTSSRQPRGAYKRRWTAKSPRTRCCRLQNANRAAASRHAEAYHRRQRDALAEGARNPSSTWKKFARSRNCKPSFAKTS